MPANTVSSKAPADALPLTVIALDDWALVTAQGQDSTSYLQGQLTLDVTALAENEHHLAAHCDAKGKMWSNLRLFHDLTGYGYLLRRQVRDQQLAELKKYAVFSKVTLAADDSRQLTGVAGNGARDALAGYFTRLPDSENPRLAEDESILLWQPLPAERFLVIAGEQKTAEIRNAIGHAEQADSRQWLALDIEAGLPVIDLPVSGEFIPQATNLQALQAISFKKGCYAGQEMVARAKYRGANKRALYCLKGETDIIPQPGDALELQMGDKWRRTGSVLAAVRLNDGQLSLQAVLSNDIEPDAVLRPQGDENGSLRPQPLPYSLEDAG